VAKIADKTVKVYFAPGQRHNWFHDPIAAWGPGPPYAAPTGWPKANYVLGLPKMVMYWHYAPNFAVSTTRTTQWRTIGNQLKSQLESTYKNLFVLFPTDAMPVGPDQPILWAKTFLDPLVPIDYANPFLGVDVFSIFIVQDFGVTRGGAASNYYDNPYGGEPPPPVAEPSPRYLAVTGNLRTAYPNFRRFTTTLYNDVDWVPADGPIPGGSGNWDNLNNTRRTWWNNVCTNGGVYGTTGMKDYDFHLGADVHCLTTTVDFFVSEVIAHFGL
jgi:hypothetical protein